MNPLFSPSSASRQPAASPFSAQAAGSARIHLRPRAARLLRCWLAALAGLLAAVAALLLLTWALLRAALAPQADEWALALGSGPGAFRASVMQLAWLGTSPWLGPWLDGARLPSAYGWLEAAWLPAGGQGAGRAPILTLRCEPCALPLPARPEQPPRVLHVPVAQLAISRDRVQHLRGTLTLGRDPLLNAAAQPLISAWWQADRAPEQDGSGWLLRLHWPAADVQDWLTLLHTPDGHAPDSPAAPAWRNRHAGAFGVDLERPMPGPRSAWRVRWQYEGDKALLLQDLPDFMRDWLSMAERSAPPRLPAPALPAGMAADADAADSAADASAQTQEAF